MVGIIERLLPPASDEFEVTLIGGADGFGECILIHLGNGSWIIVDSCINDKTGSCIPLDYLNELGVDISQQLLYVICTHWHDDHIKGLSKIISVCSSKTCFVLSCADDREKFIYELLSNYDYQGKSKVLNELINTFRIVRQKNITIKKIKQDSLIFNIDGVQGFALSPEEDVIEAMNFEIAKSLSKYHKIILQQQNL